ncbi:unnamed protein product [Paramecium sonneborni]|uniref:Uncharacterized protein n=1 Tax=Paramecium sonneborni TaxID=65129 RepID=A0A8S1MWU5_9CILI|nr:unnamed protein product [Paramecium sonneborni]
MKNLIQSSGILSSIIEKESINLDVGCQQTLEQKSSVYNIISLKIK